MRSKSGKRRTRYWIAWVNCEERSNASPSSLVANSCPRPNWRKCWESRPWRAKELDRLTEGIRRKEDLRMAKKRAARKAQNAAAGPVCAEPKSGTVFLNSLRPAVRAAISCLYHWRMLVRIDSARCAGTARGERRFDRIVQLIHSCRYSFHDLSRAIWLDRMPIATTEGP